MNNWSSQFVNILGICSHLNSRYDSVHHTIDYIPIHCVPFQWMSHLYYPTSFTEIERIEAAMIASDMNETIVVLALYNCVKELMVHFTHVILGNGHFCCNWRGSICSSTRSIRSWQAMPDSTYILIHNFLTKIGVKVSLAVMIGKWRSSNQQKQLQFCWSDLHSFLRAFQKIRQSHPVHIVASSRSHVWRPFNRLHIVRGQTVYRPAHLSADCLRSRPQCGKIQQPAKAL